LCSQFEGKKKIQNLEAELVRLRGELQQVKEEKKEIKKELGNKKKQLQRIRIAAATNTGVRLRVYVSFN